MPNTTTTTVDITIINRADGGVTAHRTGCRDIAREVKGTHADAFAMGEFASQREVTECYNADFDEVEDGWYSIDFKPCVTLPAEVEAEQPYTVGQTVRRTFDGKVGTVVTVHAATDLVPANLAVDIDGEVWSGTLPAWEAVERYAYAIKQASIGAGKWFVTETVGGTERVVGTVYGYATEAEAREVADRMAAPSHLDDVVAVVELSRDVHAELAAIEAQEAADIEREDAERAEQLKAVRDIYGDQAAELLANGWTVDSAINHVTGVCDLEACTGEHGSAWAVLVAEVTGRPEAAQAEREAELARSMAAVRDAAVAAGRQDVVEALDKLEHAKAVADYADDRGDYSAVQATAAKLGR